MAKKCGVCKNELMLVHGIEVCPNPKCGESTFFIESLLNKRNDNVEDVTNKFGGRKKNNG